MILHSLPDGTLYVARVDSDRIDVQSAIPFKDSIRELAQSSATRIILDLSRVNFIDSTGIAAIASADRALRPSQTMELASVTPHVLQVFQLTGLDRTFHIHSDLTSALGSSEQAG
nr:STAS domain-containing protein [uncultured Celeribacter sp.]